MVFFFSNYKNGHENFAQNSTSGVFAKLGDALKEHPELVVNSLSGMMELLGTGQTVMALVRQI